ncbi:hypothetical protein ACWD7T_17740 [Streptomyces sp. 900116325]|uniref:hypothetical protein n=1 Tax=Streptomyces sp. NPDC005525 TaxID=3364720 RepID=UPI0036C37357
MPVVDLLEVGVLEELGGEVIGGALGDDAAAELGRDGDRTGRHEGLLGAGGWVGNGRQMSQLGGDTPALGLHTEDVAVGGVETTVLAGEGGHDVYLPGLVAQGDPPAGVGVFVRGESDGGHQAAGDGGPLRVGEIGLTQIGTDRTGPGRPCRGAASEALDRRIERIGQVGQRIQLGEQLDRGSVSVTCDQPGVGVLSALTRPIQVREQAEGVAGALQMGDHGSYLEGERRNESPDGRAEKRGSVESAIWRGRNALVDAAHHWASRPCEVPRSAICGSGPAWCPANRFTQ